MSETPIALTAMDATPQTRANKPASLLRIFCGGLLTFSGTLVFCAGLVMWWITKQYPAISTHSTNYDADRYAWSFVRPSAEQVYFSLSIVAGGILLALGVFVAFKRYGLRGLLLATLLIGLASAVPFMSRQSDSVVTMEARCGNGIGEAQFESLRTALQPQTAMATLPEELLRKLEFMPGQATVDITVVRPAEGPGKTANIICELRLANGLEAWKRELLATFYDEHFRTELSRVLERSNTFGGDLSTDRTRPWGQWRDEWLKSRPALPSNPKIP